jgi:hypothetical protein
MSSTGFKPTIPVSEPPHTLVLDRSAAEIGTPFVTDTIYNKL